MIKRVLGISVIALSAIMTTGCGGDGNDEVRYIAAPDSGSQTETYVALDAPASLRHANLHGTDLLRWGSPSPTATAEAAGFNVYMYDPDPDRADAFVRYNTSPITDGRLEMDNLSAGMSYAFQVAAVDADGVEGARSASVSFVAVGGVDDGRGDGLPTDEGGPTPYESGGDPQQY